LAVLVVLAVVAIVALLLDRRGDDEIAAGPTVTETSVPTTTVTASTTTSLVTTTSTETTTTTQATTTTVTLVSEDGYVWVPKPATGPYTIAPGGALTKHLAADIADAFGFDVADVEAAIAQVKLPAEAGGNPEGWLAPGTYQVAGDATPQDVVQAMVDRRITQLEARGIPSDDWYRVLTAASIVETETFNQNEKPKVARVLVNRIASGGRLQMDTVILYPVPEDRIFTTAEERASDDPYNSYKYNGLPPTPISAPDEASIDAFLDPPPGDWFFYVTIDLDSGETRYAVTYAEHQENVKLMRAWLKTHSVP
jgi:UPF0755 protein